MDTLRALFIVHPIYNLPATAIRLALPHTLFALATCSHSIVVDGDHAIEPKMLYRDGMTLKSGVRRVPLSIALKGAKVAHERNYSVPDAAAGLEWARSQVGAPYDFNGAFGLSIDPFRDWQEDDMWFCHEFLGTTLHKAGRIIFDNTGHLTSRELLGIKP